MPTDEQIESYRRDGFVRIPSLITAQEALTFREAALAHSAAHPPEHGTAIFDQHVNVWTEDPAMAALTRHPAVAAAARTLAGVELRLWHDQLLIKRPGGSRATEFHQDQPYWPHEGSPNPISCWIALGDVPVESGCMTFIPGSQRLTELPMQNLGDERSLMEIAPELVWEKRITQPMRAGDATFHHGRTAHMATPNLGTTERVAHVVIFVDRDVRYTGAPHVCTDGLGLAPGDRLPDSHFPPNSFRV